jgi:hypothetical protein
METQYTVPEKPTLVNVIAWTTLASGIVNLGWGLAASAVAFLTIVGICCVPLTILPSILGIFEIIYAAKLLSTPAQPVKPAVNLAVLEVVCILAGNFFTMIVGILSLIFYNDPTVKDYFARLNGTIPPAPVFSDPQIPPVVPASPAPVVEPIPSPITGEEAMTATTPVEELPADEITLPAVEPSATEPEPPVPPEAPSAANETIISSVKRDGVTYTEPESPAPPEETNPDNKPQEE